MVGCVADEERRGQGRKGKVDCNKPLWFLSLPLLTLRSRERWGKAYKHFHLSVKNEQVTGFIPVTFIAPFSHCLYLPQWTACKQ